jgi:hypothetical protein
MAMRLVAAVTAALVCTGSKALGDTAACYAQQRQPYGRMPL